MSESVKLSYNGKEYEYPIVKGTTNDIGVDISSLRADTGLVTLDVGYKNTGSTISKITYLDGEKGELLYRGYPIEQLAEKANFTEVMYLLLNGELPNKGQFAQFDNKLKEHNFISEEMKKLIDAFPRSAHPMGMLSTLTSAMTAFNPMAVNVKDEKALDNAICLAIAKFSHLCAWTYRKKFGYPLNHGNNDLDYVSNFYYMTFRMANKPFEINQTVIDVLDKLLILHADHEQNCSASTVFLHFGDLYMGVRIKRL
ncbi:unnamed protein product [Cyprideis torosa]|uniref:Uncharacterized protein n=1 Tax=Cyprideis torosa TaxID=163714 RepID=A0A7R8ZUE1_9CRUS|nr:unnamed protein product [Cyprideis torosa]CAG0909475.1 unnamed protein product [Cyprideis torosa]